MNSDLFVKYKELIRRHRDLVEEYTSLLVEIDADMFEEGSSLHPMFFPYGHPLYIERTCALANNSDLLQMLCAPGQRDFGLKEIRDFTKDAESLTIVDPYFFSGVKSSAKQISDDFNKSARVSGKTLKRVHIVHDGNKVTNSIRQEIKNLLSKNSVQMSVKTTDEIHDRVWIADRKSAIVVGTSLNGIGTRAAFLLPLPPSDLNAILEFLGEKCLL